MRQMLETWVGPQSLSIWITKTQNADGRNLKETEENLQDFEFFYANW